MSQAYVFPVETRFPLDRWTRPPPGTAVPGMEVLTAVLPFTGVEAPKVLRVRPNREQLFLETVRLGVVAPSYQVQQVSAVVEDHDDSTLSKLVSARSHGSRL